MMELREELTDILSGLNSLSKKTEAIISKLELYERIVGGVPSGNDVKVRKRPLSRLKKADPEKNKVLKTIQNMRKRGASYEKIANHLDAKGIPTFSGRGKWRKQTVHKLYQQHF